MRGKLKEQADARKHMIQERFKAELNLLVDFAKDDGKGNTNDGNTARKAFRNFETFASITGVDVNLIRRLYVILCVINSNHKIKLDKYQQYCKETYQIYMANYSWYCMPVSVHKLLIHSVDFISIFLLPIEAQEC